MNTIQILALIAALGAVGCNQPGDAAPAVSADTASSQAVIDSIRPIEEEVRRFKASIGYATAEQLEGAASRDDLVQRLITAIERRDSVEVRQLMITPAEFIDLYFPSSAYTRPPYRQSPSFVWFQIAQNSEKGIGRALQRFGGQPTDYTGYECASEPVTQGENRLWEQCVVRWNPGQVAGTLRLFGTIIERNGRYKFVSYANGL